MKRQHTENIINPTRGATEYIGCSLCFIKNLRIMAKDNRPKEKNVKKELKEQYEKACTAYRNELLRMWELDEFYAEWIADEIGGTLDYGCGMFTLDMDEIVYCVDNDVTEAEVMVWQEYIVDASEFGFDTPNLRAWHKGCPRIPAQAFERLREMKRKLEEAIEEEKKGLKF